MEAALSRALRHPLSGKEMHDLTELRVMGYEELSRMRDMDEALGPKGALILLVRSTPRFGHWCLVMRTNHSLEFFDSYSGYPEDGRLQLAREWLEESGQGSSLLSELMLSADDKLLEYNAEALQKKDPEIMTCGRHVVCRYWFRGMPVDDYVEWAKLESKRAGITPDELVCLITALK